MHTSQRDWVDRGMYSQLTFSTSSFLFRPADTILDVGMDESYQIYDVGRTFV